MYNGIGLRTVRGSGTNGYVQRNLSHVNVNRLRNTLSRNQSNGWKNDNAQGKSNSKAINAEILYHEQKRAIELKVMELTVRLEEKGVKSEEIDAQASAKRQELTEQLEISRIRATGKVDMRSLGSSANENSSSHAKAQKKEQENERLRKAFQIPEDYEAGESFDAERKEQRKQNKLDIKAKEAEKYKAKKLELKADGRERYTRERRRSQSASKFSHDERNVENSRGDKLTKGMQDDRGEDNFDKRERKRSYSRDSSKTANKDFEKHTEARKQQSSPKKVSRSRSKHEKMKQPQRRKSRSVKRDKKRSHSRSVPITNKKSLIARRALDSTSGSSSSDSSSISSSPSRSRSISKDKILRRKGTHHNKTNRASRSKSPRHPRSKKVPHARIDPSVAKDSLDKTVRAEAKAKTIEQPRKLRNARSRSRKPARFRSHSRSRSTGQSSSSSISSSRSRSRSRNRGRSRRRAYHSRSSSSFSFTSSRSSSRSLSRSRSRYHSRRRYSNEPRRSRKYSKC